MDSKIVDEIMEELGSTLERIETQSAAVLEFIKEKGIAKEEELAPYLERAAAASNVRWRAMRVRLEHLFVGLEKSEREAEEKEKSEQQNKAKDEAGEKSSDQETSWKGETQSEPQRTEAAKRLDYSQSRSEQDHHVEARAEEAPMSSDENDKQKNAA